MDLSSNFSRRDKISRGVDENLVLISLIFACNENELSFARILDLISIIASDRLGTVFKGYKTRADSGRGV